MRWTMWSAGLLGLLGCAGAAAQTVAPAAVQLSYERDWPEQLVPFYHFVVHPNGSGVFTTDRAAGLTVAPASSAVAGEGAGEGAVPAAAAPVPGGGAGTAIQISPKTVARLFAVEGALRSGKGCQAGNRHLAQTGKKVLTLADGSGVQTCTFNYSEDKRIEDAVTAFGAIAATLEERPTLEHLRRYDRLGLDAELGNFLESAKAGRAIELENIAPLLERLVADDALMDRVRSRATTLLTMARAGS